VKENYYKNLSYLLTFSIKKVDIYLMKNILSVYGEKRFFSLQYLCVKLYFADTSERCSLAREKLGKGTRVHRKRTRAQEVKGDEEYYGEKKSRGGEE